MSGRPRTPTKVLELRGSFQKHPERRKAREREPKVSAGLGTAPDVLDEAERSRWEEVRKWAPWLAVTDRVIVEQTCRLWTLERKGKATAAQSRLLQSNLTRLGMTPADRSRVRMPEKPAGGSELDRFLFGVHKVAK